MRTLPERLLTERLEMRRPRADDANAIFARYASDPEVTRYLGWLRHRTVDDTHAFLAWCERGWSDGTDAAYLVVAREDGTLLGGTGLTFEREHRASTGYVFARDAWGRGYATETLQAMTDLAFAQPALRRVSLLCHVDHVASAHVAEKCGFAREGVLQRFLPFPNLMGDDPADVVMYATTR